jgi:hypothetical protein
LLIGRQFIVVSDYGLFPANAISKLVHQRSVRMVMTHPLCVVAWGQILSRGKTVLLLHLFDLVTRKLD